MHFTPKVMFFLRWLTEKKEILPIQPAVSASRQFNQWEQYSLQIFNLDNLFFAKIQIKKI